MSFRTRLTGFFLVIVVVPMIAVGVLVFRLIGTSEQGKADARASGLASAAVSLYESESANGRLDAETIARALPRSSSERVLRARVRTLVARSGLDRVVIRSGSRVVADIGDRSAIAPGRATVAASGWR